MRTRCIAAYEKVLLYEIAAAATAIYRSSPSYLEPLDDV